MNKTQDYIQKEISKICLKMDQKGFVANHDGNISVKFGEILLATPTSESKSEITPEMIITLDQEGKKLAGIGNPFSEIKLHLAAYKTRPDAKAVVHAHPPYATARGLVGKDLYPNLPEAVVSLGKVIPVTAFAMPGESINDKIIADGFLKSDVLLLPGNGILALGDDLEQAWLRLELTEHLCKIDSIARSMGAQRSLSTSEIEQLLSKRAKAGLGPENRNFYAQPSYHHDYSEARYQGESQINVEQLVANVLREMNL